MVTRIGQRRKAHLYIKEWLDHFELSDEKVAGRLDVARETVFRWRTEQTRLDPDKIAKLAEAIGIEPQDFYRLPAQPSLDALVSRAPDDLRKMAVDIVRRLVGKTT